MESDRESTILASFEEITRSHDGEEDISLDNRAYLLIFIGPRLPRMYPVGEEAVVGRSHQVSICIDDESVSRRHARIYRMEDGNFFVEDLSSRNGTRLNGKLVDRHMLLSGDQLQFGKSKAVVVTFRSRFEEQLIELQRVESEGRWAAGTALVFGKTLQSMRESLNTLSKLASSGQVTPGSLKSQIAYLEQGQKQLEKLTEQLHQISTVAEFEEHRINFTEQLRYLMTQIPFPEYQPFQLITDIDPDLWVLGDRDLLHQMMMELCINAVESMPEGGKLKIEASKVILDRAEALRKPFLSSGQNIRIVIEDTGIGMSPEACRRVFDPFFSTKAPLEGSGLGLMKVYQIVKSHLGHIDVVSKLGIGTTFTIYLPHSETSRST